VNSVFLGAWSGIPVILVTLMLGLIFFVVLYIIANRIDKRFTPHIIMGLTIGVLMAIMSMNLKVTSIMLNGHSFPLVLSSLFFPVLALSTDVLNEFYGLKYAKALLNGSILTQAMMFALMFWFVAIPSETLEMHNTFADTFSLATRGFIAGAVSMYLTTLVNIHTFDFFRKLTKGKMLWSRIISSTTLALLLDILIYTSILFAGTRSFSELSQMMFISAIVRMTYSFLKVPFIYHLRWLIKKQIFLVDGYDPITSTLNSP